MNPPIENVNQSDYWNGPAGRRWSESQSVLDLALAPFARAVLQRAAPRTGESVLDVGCGCGATTLLLGRAVGISGSVLGLDLSNPMLHVATERARELPQITFEVADAAVFTPKAPVDLLVSRFGIMFFENPERAFSHLKGTLKAGGRIAFVCWRSMRENPWMAVPADAVAGLLPPTPPSSPDAPGPFAFAERSRINSILEKAGFADVEIVPFDANVVMAAAPGGLPDALRFAETVGPVARALEQADENLRGRVTEALRWALAPHLVDGGMAMKGATWLVSARSGE